MFPHLTGFNLKNWIDENRGDWGRRRIIWEDSDFIIFVTRGPNNRTDFHINPGDEVFYQLEGELNLHYLTPEQNPEVAVLKEGELFLLPRFVPHSPRRGNGSWTLVIERVRQPNENDRFIWVCGKCTHTLHETTVRFNDPADSVQKAYAAMAADESLRHCNQCGQTEPAVRSDGPAFVWKG
jgi:3-hydroxyanthranilate 3,4-dioxygenase